MAKKNSKNDKKQTEKKASPFSNLIKWLWILLITGMLFTAALFVMISYTKMPDTSELENPDLEASTKILSDDLREIGRLYSKNREIVKYQDLNPYLVDALIATEDERFRNHSGIDARGLIRAVVNLSRKGGASTITQQLAKQFFTKGSRSFVKRVWQKLQEWVIAVEFERRYTKEEIIAMYLNKFEFLNQSYGISAAANNYFGKDQKALTLDEAAILIGMLKNPNYYNPNSRPDNALVRRNVVLKQMVRNNYISADKYNTLSALPIDMSNFKKPVHYGGVAPYFKSTVTAYLKKLLAQDKYRKKDGTAYDVYQDGLKVYTTINYEMQVEAEAAMKVHMKALQERYFKRWKNRDPWTYTEPDQDKEKMIAYRKNYLTRVMKETDRFQKMRSQMLSEIITQIQDKFTDARLWDSDITRMINEEKNPGYLKKLVRDEFISTKQEKVYKQILKDPLWKSLKEKNTALLLKAKKVFNQAIKMRVFAYTDTGEMTVTMSPLDSIKYHNEHMQLASVAMDPKSGYIKSWVGGIGNKYFKIDHVRVDNQVGSTFKTFLYATVVAQQAISPCRQFADVQHAIVAGDDNFGLLDTWAPKNSDGKYSGEMFTIKDALWKSKNSISVALIKELGSVELIRDLVENMGISKKKIPKAPSIILGTPDLNVLEMTAAYATFANNGVFTEPTFITKIEDSEGRLIYNSIPEQRRVLNERYNYTVVQLLQHAVHPHAYKLDAPFGGKTGTTNDFVDGWFMGISPDLVVGTWVGGENSWIRFYNSDDGYGGVMARPYYLDYMKRLENKKLINADNQFFKPEGDLIEFDCTNYQAQTPEAVPINAKSTREDEFDDEFEG